MEPIIVAEIGTNWNPNMWRASWGIAMEEAKYAGATHIKGQDWHPIEEMNRSAKWKARCAPWTLTPYKMRWIAEEALHLDLQFFTSVFTPDAAIWAHHTKAYPLIKIASSEAKNDSLFRTLSKWSGPNNPVAISFGERISDARRYMSLTMLNMRGQVIPCACDASYPSNRITADENLQEIEFYRSLGFQQGWSSHLKAGDAPIYAGAAARLGATYFEFHFQSSQTPQHAPDAGAWSLHPAEFEQCVKAIRNERD